MLSRETRVLLGSFGILGLCFVAAIVAEHRFGIRVEAYPLASFLVFAGAAVVVPQLYLAATDGEVPARFRVRFAAGATVLFALGFANFADGLQRYLILAIGLGACVALVAYEFVAGYRSSRSDRPISP